MAFKMRGIYLLAALAALVAAEEITHLPGANFDINFKHYSGFLQVSHTNFFYYWFVESQGNPQNDPLVFWFNGGPGCSSLVGLLEEMGPYQIDEEKLKQNPYAWNKLANVVYIESPAGVGFSYSTDKNVSTNDSEVADKNYVAIKEFFRKFPFFRNHRVFIAGESYAGIYVPTLTDRIIDGQPDYPIRLEGIAIGNGYLDKDLVYGTHVKYGYSHGFIDEELFSDFAKDCCGGCVETCNFTSFLDIEESCSTQVYQISRSIWHGGINPYDIYRDCDSSPSRNSKRMTHLMRGLTRKRIDIDKIIEERKQEELENLARKKVNHLYGTPCLNDTSTVNFLNNLNVRKAINAPLDSPPWEACSDNVSHAYTMNYDTVAPEIKKIVGAGVRTLLYFGDTDFACNFLLGQEFVEGLGLRRIKKKTPWKVDGQIAGFKVLFDGLSFVTVRGAGHMVPEWRPSQSFYMIQQFLNNEEL